MDIRGDHPAKPGAHHEGPSILDQLSLNDNNPFIIVFILEQIAPKSIFWSMRGSFNNVFWNVYIGIVSSFLFALNLPCDCQTVLLV